MFGSTKKFEQRVKSLEESLGRLERAFQQLDLEWVNAYGKFRKIASRISHDQDVIDSRHSETGTADGDSPPPGGNTIGGPMSAHQKQVQQQILRRRAGITQ